VSATYATKASPTFTGTVTIPAGASISGYATQSYVTTQGYLTDAPSNGSEYVRKNGAWSVVTGGGGGISDAPSDGNLYARQNGGWFGFSATPSVTNIDLTGNFNGYSMGSGYYTFKFDSTANTLRMQDGVGSGITISATGITFPDATTLTTATGGGGGLTISSLSNAAATTLDATAPTTGQALTFDGTELAWATISGSGGLTISDLSNAAATTLNATAPTTGQALTFDGTELKWDTIGGGGGVSWGGITGTVTDQTDLTSYISGLGYITSVPSKTVNVQTSNYTLIAGDTNNILYFSGVSATLTIQDDASYSFPVGTHIMVATNSCTINVVSQDTMTPAPVIQGTTSFTTGIYHLIKVAANTWVID
jgi:hypothetical protein